MKPIRVSYEVPDQSGCTFYRVQLPLRTAAIKGTLLTDPIDKYGSIGTLTERLKLADVIMAGRPNSPKYVDMIARLQEGGQKFVCDWDDDVFCVSPLSPHYEDFGVQEYSHRLPDGSKIKVWRDGHNIDLKANRARLDAIKKILEKVDGVFVTTDNLASVYRQFNDKVWTLPNCVDLNVWKRPAFAPRINEIRMGWFGGSSHYEDWLEIAPAVRAVMAAYPYLKLVIMGQRFEGTLKGIPKTQIESHAWTHIEAYPYKAAMLDLDFAIIPLKDTDFNRAKSPIKWIEMAALRTPAVTSFIEPYSQLMDLVPDNGIFVENSTDAWVDGISVMINNLKERETMGAAAYETVRQNFDINTQFSQWVNALQEVKSWSPRQTQPSMN